MHADHAFHILGLSRDAKPEEVGPAYLARAKELALVVQNGDIVAVSKAIEELHELHDAYSKALEASERQVQLLSVYNNLISPDSTQEERILAGLQFLSGADERHVKMLERILFMTEIPESIRLNAALKMHSIENRSDLTHRGTMIAGYPPSLDTASYSNVSGETLHKMAKAVFLPDEVRDFVGSRIIARLLVQWKNGVLDDGQVREGFASIANDVGYTAKTRGTASDLAKSVGSAMAFSRAELQRWRPDTLPRIPQPRVSKTPRPQ